MRTIALALAGLALAAAQLSLQADAAESASSLMNVKVPAALIAKAKRPEAARQRKPQDEHR
jgi:hypothetical protein